MAVLTIADSFYIGVLDLAAATAWYTEKLGLQKVPLKIDDEEGCIVLGFFKERSDPYHPRASHTDWWGDADAVRF